MGSHDSFGYLKHKLWAKDGAGIKLPIWLHTIKSRESPRFPCVQVAYFRLHLDWTSAHKVMDPKIVKVRILRISKLLIGNHGTKWHLGASPMARHKVYYKGEDKASPKSGLWWFLWVCVCQCLVSALKCSNYTLPTSCLVCARLCE
jgi:hypothetical protein